MMVPCRLTPPPTYLPHAAIDGKSLRRLHPNMGWLRPTYGGYGDVVGQDVQGHNWVTKTTQLHVHSRVCFACVASPTPRRPPKYPYFQVNHREKGGNFLRLRRASRTYLPHMRVGLREKPDPLRVVRCIHAAPSLSLSSCQQTLELTI